jgi:cation diffusion facilitator family transporter
MNPPAHLVHDHVFDEGNPIAERGTRLVMWITLATMVVEIGAGWWFNSMALLADGWHMSSHALAIGLAALAYHLARRHARDPRFAFGTWKIEILSGYSSAILLLVVAAMMVIGSVERLLEPRPIQYLEAMVVAVVGLAVNVACALILGHAHNHDHGHGHGHDHHDHHDHGEPGHTDLNLRAAYVHVLVDAVTSVLAIAALAGGWLFGWSWLDPAMGIVGALLVAIWAKGLLVDSGKILLDREMDHPVVAEIREVIESDGDVTQITDLHVWRVGKGAYSCAVTVASSDPALTPELLRQRLAIHAEIVHSTLELHIAPAASAGV